MASFRKRNNMWQAQVRNKHVEKENPNKICFVTNRPISPNNLSIHHVIPWSYMYSDDLWNLVYVDKIETVEYQTQYLIKVQ